MLPVAHSSQYTVDVIPVPSLPAIDELLAPSSIAMYQRDVAAYAAFVAERGLDARAPRSLDAWRDHLAQVSTLSPNTINRMLAAVKRLVREASRREAIDPALSVAFDQVPGVKVKAQSLIDDSVASTLVSFEYSRREMKT